MRKLLTFLIALAAIVGATASSFGQVGQIVANPISSMAHVEGSGTADIGALGAGPAADDAV